MAKLYAEISSDKAGRVVSKGGDKKIKIELTNKNAIEYRIEYDNAMLFIYNDKGEYLGSHGVPF